jgi:hypothetical protein
MNFKIFILTQIILLSCAALNSDTSEYCKFASIGRCIPVYAYFNQGMAETGLWPLFPIMLKDEHPIYPREPFVNLLSFASPTSNEGDDETMIHDGTVFVGEIETYYGWGIRESRVKGEIDFEFRKDHDSWYIPGGVYPKPTEILNKTRLLLKNEPKYYFIQHGGPKVPNISHALSLLEAMKVHSNFEDKMFMTTIENMKNLVISIESNTRAMVQE